MAIERSDRGASGIDGVAAAPGCPGLIATWSSTAVYVSRDDGATFAEAFADKPGPVRAVAVSPRCEVWAGRGAHLGVLGREGTTRWQQTPTSATTESLATSAAGLLWLGRDDKSELSLAFVDPRGRARLLPTPPRGNAGNEMHLDDDGTIWWMHGSEAACGGGQSRSVGHVDGRDWKDVPWSLDTPGGFAEARDGWTYAIGGCTDRSDDARGLCAIDRHGRSRRALPIAESSYALLVASTHDRTVAVAGNQLVALDGARATVLATVSGDPRAVAIDGHGRALVVTDGRLQRLDGRRLRALGPSTVTASSR
jgi:hypothetical protein